MLLRGVVSGEVGRERCRILVVVGGGGRRRRGGSSSGSSGGCFERRRRRQGAGTGAMAAERVRSRRSRRATRARSSWCGGGAGAANGQRPGAIVADRGGSRAQTAAQCGSVLAAAAAAGGGVGRRGGLGRGVGGCRSGGRRLGGTAAVGGRSGFVRSAYPAGGRGGGWWWAGHPVGPSPSPSQQQQQHQHSSFRAGDPRIPQAPRADWPTPPCHSQRRPLARLLLVRELPVSAPSLAVTASPAGGSPLGADVTAGVQRRRAGAGRPD